MFFFSICKYVLCFIVLSHLIMNSSRCELLFCLEFKVGNVFDEFCFGFQRNRQLTFSGGGESKPASLLWQSFLFFFLLELGSQAPSLGWAPRIHL